MVTRGGKLALSGGVGAALFGRLQDRKRTFSRDTSKKRFAKKQKARKGVHTSMLTFLQEEHIRTKIVSSNGKPNNTSGVMIQAHGGFSRQCTVWKPFHKLRPLLTDLSQSRHLLTPNHYCVLFEDFLALCPGT